MWYCGCGTRPSPNLLFESLQFTTRLRDVVCARQCFATESRRRTKQNIRSRSSKLSAMRVDHEHFARARECAKNHEKILAALPRETLGRDRENIRLKRAQGFEAFEVTAGLELGARDRLDRAVGIKLDQFVVPARRVAAEGQQNNFHPRKLPSTNTSEKDRPVLV